MAVLPQREQREQSIHARIEHTACQSTQASYKLQVFAPGQVLIEVWLFGHVADSSLKRCEIGFDVSPTPKDLALARLDESRKDFDCRALAGAIRSKVAEDFSRAYSKADAIHSRDAAVALCQTAHFEHRFLRHRRTTRLFPKKCGLIG